MDFAQIQNFNLEKKLPKKVRPFYQLARMDKPIGVWLLLLPGLWSIILASGGPMSMNHNDWKLIVLFALGALVMRPAGCVINDLWDRDIDAQVRRTKKRPLASGKMQPREAVIFLLGLLLIGAYVLFQMNIVAVLLGVMTLPLIAAYPVMKRVTWWPQVFLGITFNFGALIGWAAVTATVDLAALCLYLSGVLWTIGYDTIYAHQDKDDDSLIGVRSTALRFGKDAKQWVAGFYAGASIFLVLGFALAFGHFVYGIFALPAAAHLYRQIEGWNVKTKKSALATFQSNRDYGLIVLILCCIATIF